MSSISKEDFNGINDPTEELKKIAEEFKKTILQEFINPNRPASEVILDDVDLQKILKVSRRQTASLREQKIINYSQPIPKGKIFYTLQDVLDFINRGRVESIFNQRKF